MMKDLAGKTATKVSQEEVFQALSYAALKARAGRIAPNQILHVGNFELIVAHDEEGGGDGGADDPALSRFAGYGSGLGRRAGRFGAGLERWREESLAGELFL